MAIGLAIATGSFAESLASAQSYSLAYQARDGCPPEQHFVDAVVARLGSDPFTGEGPSLEVHAQRSGAHQFEVRLLLEQGEQNAERVFNARRCEDGVDAAAVAFSVLFAEIQRQEQTETTWDAPPAWPEPSPSGQRTPEPPPAVEPAPEPSFRLGIFAGGGAELGRFSALSAVAVGGFSLGDVSHWLRLQFWYAATFGESDLDRTSRAGFTAYGGSVGGCLRFGWPLLCTDFELGAVAVHATSLQPSDDTALYSAWVLEGGAHIEISGGLSLIPMLRVGVALSPPEVFVAEESRWHAAPLFSGFALRLHWRPV